MAVPIAFLYFRGGTNNFCSKFRSLKFSPIFFYCFFITKLRVVLIIHSNASQFFVPFRIFITKTINHLLNDLILKLRRTSYKAQPLVQTDTFELILNEGKNSHSTPTQEPQFANEVYLLVTSSILFAINNPVPTRAIKWKFYRKNVFFYLIAVNV